MRPVKMAFRIEPDDGHSVWTFAMTGGLPATWSRSCLRPDWSSQSRHLPAAVGHNAGIRLDPPCAARQFSWNEDGIGPPGQTGWEQAARGKGACHEHWAQDCRKKSSHPFVLLVAIVVSRKAISQYLGWRGRRTAKSNATGSGPCFRATISGEFHPFSPKNGPDHGLCGAPVDFTTRFAFRAGSGYDRDN